MAKNLIAVVVLISLWYIKEVIYNTDHSLFKMLILLLVYLCLVALYLVFSDKKKFKYVVSLIKMIFVIIASMIFQPMAYFLGITVFLMLETFFSKYIGNRMYLTGVSILYLLIIQDEFMDSFILITLFSLIILYIDDSSRKRINSLQVDRNRLRLELDQQEKDLLNLKLFELNKENALKIEERNSIAQKLHDELGHTLSGSTMQIEAALMLLDKDEDKSKHMLRTVIRNLREGTDSTRRILRNIKPETASMNIQTIKLLVFETQEKSGISIDLIYDHDIVFLDHTMWYVITINVKEALTNLMKYSQATKCSIKFESLNQRYKVSINDNGIGCQNIKQGMGLSGMEERIHQVGGQLIVDGSDGFSIIMLLPLEKGM